jgi:hypothetical protein
VLGINLVTVIIVVGPRIVALATGTAAFDGK